jgi:CHAD domain-containing protein
MQIMSEPSNFLFKAYKKKADSLVTNLDPSTARLETGQIHTIRLAIKRIRAIFQLLEILDPDGFSSQKDGHFLRTLFRAAGRMRELQVSRLIVDQWTEKPDIIHPFKDFLRSEEKRYRRNLTYAIRHFDAFRISEVAEKIIQIEREIPPEKIIENAVDCIAKTNETIRKLNAGQANPVKMHKIRQHLRALAAIASLVSSKRPDDKLKNLITTVKNTDLRLGQWHDHVVLAGSLDSFLAIAKEETGEIQLSLQLLAEKMKQENRRWVHTLKPTVQSTIGEIVSYI